MMYMTDRVVSLLSDIERAVAKKIGFPRNQTVRGVYEAIAEELNETAHPQSWGYSYIRNVALGLQTPGGIFITAVKQLHKKYIKTAKKKKPDYRLRPVQILCTGKQYEKIIKSMSTEERANRLINSSDPLKEKPPQGEGGTQRR